MKNRLSLLNYISKEKGFVFQEVEFGQTSINEKIYEKPFVSIAAITPRVINQLWKSNFWFNLFRKRNINIPCRAAGYAFY